MLYVLQKDSLGFLDNDVNSIRLLIEGENWFYNTNENIIRYKHIDNLSEDDLINGVPVGSVEFVQKFVNYHNKPFYPINIPDELNKYKFLKRKIWKIKGNEVISLLDIYGKLFVKPNEKIKEFDAFELNNSTISKLKGLLNINVMVSECINIISEWRVFVKKGPLSKTVVDSRPYSWEKYPLTPDWDLINKMIEEYKNSPPAYTLDVGITDTGETVLIEVHNFLACGLYGADNFDIPKMINRAYKWQISQ